MTIGIGFGSLTRIRGSIGGPARKQIAFRASLCLEANRFLRYVETVRDECGLAFTREASSLLKKACFERIPSATVSPADPSMPFLSMTTERFGSAPSVD